MAQKIIIDCDPGIDDALAVVFAHGDPGLEVCGITTVAGNVSLDKTTDNALRVRDFVRMGDVPVVPGSARPLVRPVLDARDVHGDSGLAGAVLPAALSGPSPGHAVDYLIDVTSAAPGEITLIAVGPLTNVALAVRREPALTSLVRDFVIMGGSAGRGNATPAAEFNVLADPEAAAIVFSAGWTVTMVGLDVTLQARVTAAVRERMRGLGPLADDLLLPSLAGYRTIAAAQAATAQEPGMPAEPDWPDDLGDPAVHDVCAVARVACPELIGCVPALVQVETAGRLTSGMTVTDFAAPAAQCNALVATSIDVGGFWDLVLGSYERVAAGMAGQ
ncbi:MAG TPA: nucleoside hydrolase [Streptosporangiaceae bacterium]|nr:nucleoside hydrolase [Streptosporangiaceae bacterium]